jgi:hypothetical protein
MALLDHVGFRTRLGTPPDRRHALTCRAKRRRMVDDRHRIVLADDAACFALHRQPASVCGSAKKRAGTLASAGSCGPDELAVRIVVEHLLRRRIDAQGVDAGRARLHLELAVVDAGLEVDEVPCQEGRYGASAATGGRRRTTPASRASGS